MNLRKELLISTELDYEYSDEFQDCLNAHGIYNSEKFVLRLSSINHDNINKITEGKIKEFSFEEIQSYSTYLHETIHWWQHIGSTMGLIMSLSYPAQTHRNVEHLRMFLEMVGAKKPIDIYNRNNATEIKPSNEKFNQINIIINNYHDLEFFRSLIVNPKSAHSIVNSDYFESVGHSFKIGYSYAIGTIAEVFDREFNYFPNPDVWISEFEKLNKDRVEGFFFRSDIKLPPLGLKEILEGQARFCQLQFLHFALDKSYDWEDFAGLGQLDGIYFKAFQTYLEITGFNMPDSIDDPLVALFLLVCDIAINPGEGFPFDIKDFQSFIISTDPGFRFYLLCHAIKKNSKVGELIKEYSREEYEKVAEILCEEAVTFTPAAVCFEVINWAQKSEELKTLLREEEEFNFKNENLPIRVIFSKFIRFCQDKFEHPEFFCWPGYWKAGGVAANQHKELWLKHLSLFMDKKNDKGIYPREFPRVPEENINKTFNNFYAWNIMYDLSRQWIINEGSFKYDYSWLSESYDENMLKEYADKIFNNIYGEYPDNFEILKKT